jgi:hypothetical protein
MDADEIEDDLELQDPAVKEFIARGHEEYLAGHYRPVGELLAEIKRISEK